MKRTLAISFAAAIAVSAIAAPAIATQPDDDGLHKVWICHRTLSETNPFVVIPVDAETWDDDQNGHNRPHNNAPDDAYLWEVVRGQPKPSADVECGRVEG